MMRLSSVLRKFLWIPWATLALSLTVYVLSILVHPEPPVEFISATPSKSRVSIGGSVSIGYDIVRNRSCPAIAALGWVDKVGSTVMYLSPIIGGAGRLGTQTVNIAVPVPDRVGYYCLRLVTHYTCSRQEFDTPAPEVCLEIIE